VKGEEVERMERSGRRSPETEATTVNAMTLSMAKEATTSLIGNNRAHSNGRCGKNECSDGETSTARNRVSSKKSICYGCG